MTEADWLTATDPIGMLVFLRGKLSDRKQRLFAVGCCWDDKHPLWEGASSSVAVAVAARYADGHATAEELGAAQAAVYRQIENNMYGDEPVWDPTYYTCAPDINEGLFGCLYYSVNRGASLPFDLPDHDMQVKEMNDTESRFQATLLRDIFNPFRPVAFDPAWRSWPTRWKRRGAISRIS